MKRKSNFDDPIFKAEDDKLEAQMELQREKNRKQERIMGGW